ncbi:hypothetical protein KFU94_27590 [Chloroflexi bacterium TSY]|nr:hypothetical protein [Chloroflexi bacterium TSY]
MKTITISTADNQADPDSTVPLPSNTAGTTNSFVCWAVGAYHQTAVVQRSVADNRTYSSTGRIEDVSRLATRRFVGADVASNRSGLF